MRTIYILFLLMSHSYLWADSAITPVAKLPESFQDYKVTDRLDYTGKDLFEYINGGAEMYLSYGLIGMKGYKYNAEELPQITVEVYEMTEGKNAFGVFTQSRDKDESDYGQGSQDYGDAILFWKGSYFIAVSAHQETQESREAMRHFASILEQSIPEEGEIPSVVGALPKEDLQPGGFLYFHHYIWLNSYYFIADYNIIDIDERTDAVLGKYGPASARTYLLMAEYPDKPAASKAFGQLSEKFAPEAKAGATIQLEDNTWFKTWEKDNKLGAIFNAPTKEYAEKIYQESFNNM